MPLELTKEWLIVCEGGGDKAFLQELIRRRGLPDFQVQYPLKGDIRTGGWTKSGNFLNEIKTNEGFIQNVRAILIVADNDDDPQKRFGEIQALIRMAGGYGVPAEPLRVARSVPDLPDVVVMMLPLDGIPGNLETILLPAAYDKWPSLEAPLSEYESRSPANDWPQRKQSKMRMQCILAATCKQDPNTTIGSLWGRPEEYHIPVEHPCFDNIAEVLQRFGTLLD